ncbi:MAG TPA: HlyD family efflux transporter periplasmic adaptor subunit [Dehalococcoidia bacterium]|jgi:multidrug resistance efflux pump|nr:HlyD family efflux transporter periplasmic adaptor subunit [Dehalococcoidia bacterium]|tara:strand:+ start:3110 stop:3811 length:702 start_codon:yes stop_codon:yes gene_type:complete
MSRYLILGAAGLILAIVGASIFGFDQWSKSDLSGRFVSSNNAQVVADLVQVGSINAGRIVAMDVDVGSTVLEGQVIAVVDIPAVISRSSITDTSKMGFRDVQDQLFEVVAPRSGVIAARWAKKGDTLPAGQRIATLVDQRRVWIEANIDEKKIERVRPGQPVEIEITGRDGKLTGKVETVSPVTAATLASPSDRGLAGNGRRVAQVIPVKIRLDEDNLSLIPGSSAEITIWVR